MRNNFTRVESLGRDRRNHQGYMELDKTADKLRIVIIGDGHREILETKMRLSIFGGSLSNRLEEFLQS